MPDIRRHLWQAKHNQAFLNGLDCDAFPDWFVTTCFYKAVHLVDAYLAVDLDTHPDNHGQRERGLGRLLRQPVGFGRVRSRYRDLRHLSEGARYRCQLPTPEDIERAENDYLPAIEEWVTGALEAKGFGDLL